MGDIRVKFRATRRRYTLRGEAIVDSGAQTSVLGLDDACQLGVDVARARRVDRITAGGLTLTGLQLTNVLVEAGGRKAMLDDVFVPIAQIVSVRDKRTGKSKKESRAVARDESPLLGQDFLQRSKSMLDFETDTLRGLETLGPPVSLSRRFRIRPASKANRELIRALASCRR